ncbi:uncharacterized protein MYCFIDRAFT_217163 [Pseudocercospora fijiensis CIRAD86]|uniref:Uncharacterized protein n=1 Tax=Pseudocercospora fijiensis (strain CIRAD86) TaxID=383855 RepID=M2ZCH6_PSEFD|nr:uncharacterized protein MYCFIDRAFT_217163 [Pseudocercospora fijiensis CIRAD86]EME76804.1 hypothetical protein MYCFIDRAFT_217163 [Pseudocercospora fijiensis CIRAD86]
MAWLGLRMKLQRVGQARPGQAANQRQPAKPLACLQQSTADDNGIWPSVFPPLLASTSPKLSFTRGTAPVAYHSFHREVVGSFAEAERPAYQLLQNSRSQSKTYDSDTEDSNVESDSSTDSDPEDFVAVFAGLTIGQLRGTSIGRANASWTDQQKTVMFKSAIQHGYSSKNVPTPSQLLQLCSDLNVPMHLGLRVAKACVTKIVSWITSNIDQTKTTGLITENCVGKLGNKLQYEILVSEALIKAVREPDFSFSRSIQGGLVLRQHNECGRSFKRIKNMSNLSANSVTKHVVAQLSQCVSKAPKTKKPAATSVNPASYIAAYPASYHSPPYASPHWSFPASPASPASPGQLGPYGAPVTPQSSSRSYQAVSSSPEYGGVYSAFSTPASSVVPSTGNQHPYRPFSSTQQYGRGHSASFSPPSQASSGGAPHGQAMSYSTQHQYQPVTPSRKHEEAYGAFYSPSPSAGHSATPYHQAASSSTPHTRTAHAHHMVASPPKYGYNYGDPASPDTSTSHGGALEKPSVSHSNHPTTAVKPPRSSLLDDPEESLTATLAGWNLGPVASAVKQEEQTLAASPLEEQRLRENLSRHIPPDQVEDILRLRREGILRSPSRLDGMVPSAPAAHPQQPYLASIDAALHAFHRPDYGSQPAQPMIKQEQAPGASEPHPPNYRQLHPSSTQSSHTHTSRDPHQFGRDLQYSHPVPSQEQARPNPPPQTHTPPAQVASAATLQGFQKLHCGSQFTHLAPSQVQVARPKSSQSNPPPAQTAGTSTSHDVQQMHYGSQFAHPAPNREQVVRPDSSQAHPPPAQTAGTSTSHDVQQMHYGSQSAYPAPNREQVVRPDSSQTHPPPAQTAGTPTSQDLLPLHHGPQSTHPMSNPEQAVKHSVPATAHSRQVHTMSTEASSDAALSGMRPLSFGMHSAHTGFMPPQAAHNHMVITPDHLQLQNPKPMPATTAHAENHMPIPPNHLQVQSMPATTAHAAGLESASLIEPAQSISPQTLSELSSAQVGAKEEISQQSDMPPMRAQAQTAPPASVQVPSAGNPPPWDFAPRLLHALGQCTPIPYAGDGPNMIHGLEFRSPDSTQPVTQSQPQSIPAMPSSQHNQRLHNPFINEDAAHSSARAPMPRTPVLVAAHQQPAQMPTNFGTGLEEAL